MRELKTVMPHEQNTNKTTNSIYGYSVSKGWVWWCSK